MNEKIGYSLKVVKASEVPTRGKWKAIALNLIEQFDQLPERNVEVLNENKPFKNKKDMMSLYDALKSIIKKHKLNLEAKTKGNRLFLVKEMRYFIK